MENNPLKPLNSILVKPAGPDCNMACTYCFYNEKTKLFPGTKNHRMSGEILEVMIRQLMEQSGRQVSITWQGGEPTLMGLPFFEKAVELQQVYGHGQNVGNGLQTNGILINKAWADFLGRYKFLVGLSIDGPQRIHDRYRRLKGGSGSWTKVLDSARLLLDKGVAVNAISVVNNYSVEFPEEIYAFHKSEGLYHMQFIPCVETDPKDPQKAAPFSVSAQKYGTFLCRLFDLWMSDFVSGLPTTSIRFIDSIISRHMGIDPPECSQLKTCGVYVVVEHNGDVYACDFFVEPQWKLGNIREDRLLDMLNSDKQRKFGRAKSTLPGVCRRCKWLKNCYGGCVKDRIRDPRDENLNHFCLSFKMFYEYADGPLRKLAEKWRKQQP